MAAILLALMVLVFTGLLAISMFLKRGQGAQDRVTREQSASLEYSRNLLVGFVMREGRLPCVAQAPHGKEDCAATNPKGWLPTGTLDPVAAAPNTQGRLPVRYMVYRGAGADLTSATTNEYIPSDASGAPLADYPVVNSTLDTCRKLYLMESPPQAEGAALPGQVPVSAAAIADTPSRWSMAYGLKGTAADTRQPYVMLGTETVNVAFGLAAPPAGASTASSGENANVTSAQMEIPGRRPDANYRDQVLIEDAGALSRTLGCAPAQASVDVMAMAAGWPAAAVAARATRIADNEVLIAVQSLFVASSGVAVLEDTATLGDAIAISMQAALLKAIASALLVLQPGNPAWTEMLTNATTAATKSTATQVIALVSLALTTIDQLSEDATLGAHGEALAGAPALTNTMLAQGISVPTGRGAGMEDRYVYQDSNGAPHELQVCFQTVQWSVAGTSSASFVPVQRHVMHLTGMTVELALQMDAMVDGSADARFGDFRQTTQASSTSAAGVEWPPVRTAVGDDAVPEVEAYLLLN
ncbi:hypothetical protein A9977_01340 [Variovorax sp. UMC13]|nr:hypothetical protein [Variovorax sp. UMC13]